MSELRPPFILIEDGTDQGILASLEELTSYVEAVDVRDGIFRVYDSAGRIIALRAETDVSEVTAVATDECDREALDPVLRASARSMLPGRLGRDERWVEAATTEELADHLLELEVAFHVTLLHVRMGRFVRRLPGRVQ